MQTEQQQLQSPRPTETRIAPRRPTRALLEAIRPTHWIKNAFVLAPLLFSGRFMHFWAWVQALTAVAAFCMLAGGVYLINDVFDVRRDRTHPVKSQRPIASGALSISSAIVSACICIAVGLAMATWLEIVNYHPSKSLAGYEMLVWTLLYVIINLAYSAGLKHHAIVDVVIVAFGFVLRAMAGAAAIGAPVSPWLVICTFTLCLFLALTKRHSEISHLDEQNAVSARPANRVYFEGFLDHMIAVSSGLAIMTYTLYCVAPRTIARFGSAHMIWTVPLVVYGMFRYWYISRRHGQGDPISTLVTDRIMWLVIVVYALMSAAIITWGGHPSVSRVLDV